VKKLTAIVLALACVAACHRERPAGPVKKADAPKVEISTPPPTDVGNPMPPYEATNLDGSHFDLAAQKGSVVLVNVWATWCGPCRIEIPSLQEVHEKYAGRGFKVVGISVDEGGADGVKSFVSEYHVRYPIVLDAEGRIANLLQTTVLPTSLLLDRKGKIVWRQIGQIDRNDASLTAAIEKAIR